MKKAIIAAAAIATALVAGAATGAQAKTNVDIHLGFGGYYGQPVPVPHYNSGSNYRHKRAHRRTHYILPRWKVRRKLRHRGFRRCHNLRLRHESYKARCFKRGRLFKLRVDAYNGHIIRRHRIRY